MKINVGLLLDLGNSETRVAVKMPNGVEKDVFLSNRFAVLPPEYVVPKEYQDKNKTTIICVDGAYYANGLLAEMEFGDKLTRPSAVEYKTDQLVTTLTIHMAFLTAYKCVSEQYNIPIEALDVTFNVSILLPPLEHGVVGNAKCKELVKEHGQLKALLPKVEKKLLVDNVLAYPEGVAAFIGACFKEENGVMLEEPEMLEYTAGYVLVLDIGAGTTDVVLIKDSQVIQASKESFNKGCNLVVSTLRNDIRKHYKFAPADLTSVMADGLLHEGTIAHKVEKLVTSAKESYSKMLLSDITEYLERMMVSLRTVKGILVVGGGSLPTSRDGVVVSAAMSDVLVDYLRVLAPSLEVISTANTNPRLLNLRGLKHMHNYTEAERLRELQE